MNILQEYREFPMSQKLYEGFLLNSHNDSRLWEHNLPENITACLHFHLPKLPRHQLVQAKTEPRQYGSRTTLLTTTLSSLSQRAWTYSHGLSITIGSCKVNWRELQRNRTSSSFHSGGLFEVKELGGSTGRITEEWSFLIKPTFRVS